jgi:hypothetical protein
MGGHPPLAGANEGRLILDIVQRVGHENAIEIREWPRPIREISRVRRDAHAIMGRRNRAQPAAVAVHRVNRAAWREQGRKRKRERPIAASQVGPGRRPERLEVAAGEHVDRVTPPHQRSPSVALGWPFSISPAAPSSFPEQAARSPAYS